MDDRAEITNGCQLIVGPAFAILRKEGQIADIYGPAPQIGNQNIPI